MLNIFLAAIAVGLMNNGKAVGVCGMELSKPYVVEASGVDLTDETRVESEEEDEEYAYVIPGDMTYAYGTGAYNYYSLKETDAGVKACISRCITTEVFQVEAQSVCYLVL